MSIRLVVAEDHAMVLEGLLALLALEPDIEVVEACKDGVEALDAIGRHAPDVVVMDAAMPSCDGLEAIGQLRASDVRPPVVVLTATLDDDTLLRCMALEVEGLVLKESAAARLVGAIRRVAAEERSIPRLLVQRAEELLAQRRDGPINDLTPREREVVVLVAGGQSNKRVAAELGVTEGTVKLHLHSAYRKLDISNRVQLSLMAREQGWI